MAGARCGSDEITRDAWAGWDTYSQMWQLMTVFDNADCHDCDTETIFDVQDALVPLTMGAAT